MSQADKLVKEFKEHKHSIKSTELALETVDDSTGTLSDLKHK